MKKTACLFLTMILLFAASCGEKLQVSDPTPTGSDRPKEKPETQMISDNKADDEPAYGEHTVWGYYPGEDGFTDCRITFHEAIVEDKTIPVIVRNSGGMPDEVRDIDVTVIRLRPGSDVTVPVNLESDNPAFSKAVCKGAGMILESGTYDIALGGFGEMEHLDGFFSGKAEDIVPEPNSLRVLHTTQFDTKYCFIELGQKDEGISGWSASNNTTAEIVDFGEYGDMGNTVVVHGRDEAEALEGTSLESGTVLISDNCAIRLIYDLIMDDVDAAEEKVNGWAKANGYVHVSEAQQDEETPIYVTACGGNFAVAAVVRGEGNFRSGVEAGNEGVKWRYYQKNVLWTVEDVTGWKILEVREMDHYEENGQQYPCYVMTLMVED